MIATTHLAQSYALRACHEDAAQYGRSDQQTAPGEPEGEGGTMEYQHKAIVVEKQPTVDMAPLFNEDGSVYVPTVKTEPQPCPRCRGCGQIADSQDGEPWSMWLEMPLQSALAVLAGIVRPLPCPRCDGVGTIYTASLPGASE